jgi:DNA-directed RNA polymerase sigma subunit (sigma70/sigma32)
MTREQLTRLGDLKRLIAYRDRITDRQDKLDVDLEVRRITILAAYRHGATLSEIGDAAGLSKQRVHQIIHRQEVTQ